MVDLTADEIARKYAPVEPQAAATPTTADEIARKYTSADADSIAKKYNFTPPPPQPKGNLLTGGVAVGWNELQGLSDLAIAAGAGAIGAKDTQQEYIKAGQEQFREAQQYARPELELAPWQEGFKWSNLPAQIVYQSAKQIPMTAATLGAGGLVGQALKRAGIQALPKFAAGALSEAAEDIAGKKISAAAIQKAAQPVATTTAASYPLSVGSVYQEQVEKGDMSPGAAVTTGALAIPHALLESLEVGQLKNLFSRGMPSAATKKGLLEWMKGTAGAAAKATAGETVAETGQAIIEQSVRTDLTPAQKADTILQSAFMGGIAGFGLGGGAHIIGSALSPTKNVRPDQLNDEALRTVVDTALNPQTAQQRLDAAVEASTDMRAPPAPERAEPTMSGLRQGPPGSGEAAIEISPEDRIRGGVEPAPTGAETLRQEVAPEQPAGTIDIPQPAQAPLSTARSTMPLPDAPLAHIENDQLQTMFERATDPQLKAQVRQEMEARLAPAQPATPTFEQTQRDARQELINTLGLTGQAAREAQKLDIKHPMEAFTLAQAQIAERAKKGRGLSPLLEKINEQYGIVDESNNPLTAEDLQRVQAREQLVVDTAPNELVRENAQYRVDQIGRQLENRAAAEEYAAGATERAATQPTMEPAAPEIPQAAEAAAADAGIKRAERRAFIKAFTDAATTTGGAPEEYLTKSAKAGFAAGQEYRARQAETSAAPTAPAAPAGMPPAPQTFTTAKGSTYTVRPDGTTIRNKAARPEHPGEEGIQPPSQKTVYMAESEMNKLAEIQAKGGARTTLTFDDATGTVAIKYLEGKDAGKIERRTVAKFETQPRVGLSPLEFFGDNYTPHFGNKITKLEQPTATETPSAATDTGYTAELEGKNKRQVVAEVERIKQEQIKREQLLADPSRVAAYAAEKGIPTNEMQSLLENNYRDNAPRLTAYELHLRSMPEDRSPQGMAWTNKDIRSRLEPISYDVDTYSDKMRPTTESSGLTAPIVSVSGRPMVTVDINGVRVPFYISTGMGGKTDVPAGRWYPFFGIGKDGWFNKTRGADITNYYGSTKLREIAEQLDTEIGDVRNAPDIPEVAKFGGVSAHINRDVQPVERTESSKPDFENKIRQLIQRIEQPAATEIPSAVQEQGPTGVYVQPAAETGGAVGERDTERREAAGARVEAAPEITERPTRPTSPVGEDVASMTTPPTPETGYGGRSQVDKQFTRLTEKMRRAYAYGTTLWNQVERFGKIVPALQNFWHATTQRDAFESQIADIAITPLDQFSQLVRKSRDAADRIQRIAKEARNGMDARKPWAAHTWLHKLPDAAEYKRRHDIIRTDLFNLQRGGQDKILTGLIDLNTTIRQLTNTIILHRYLTTQIKSDPTIAPAFAQRLARLSPITTFQESSATRDLASAATHFDQLYDKLYQLAKDYVQRYPDNLGSAELNKNIKELQRQHVEYRQAPYFHLGRSGDHGIKFKLSLTPDGLVDKAAANRVVKALADAKFDDFEISPLGTDPNVFLMVQHEDQRKDIAKILQGMVTTGEIQRDTLTDGPLVEGQKINNAPQIVQEIINRIAASDTDDPDVQQQNSQTMRVLSKFATDMLAENDARKSLIRRKNIEGFDKNIIGSMAEDIERRVRMLGRLAGTSDVYDALNAMRAQARQAQNPTSPDYKHRDQIATVAAQRQRLEYEIGMTTANPIVTFLTGINYGATMGFRVATAVTQILQVPQLLVPVLMKQRGVGFVDAYKAVGRATSLAFEIMRAAVADAVENRTAQQWFDAPVSTKVIERANISDTLKRFMILYMNTHGAGNNSLARELGHLYNEHEVGGSWKTAVGTAQKMGTSLVYYAETFSRVLAALSAYEAYQGDKTSAEGLRKVRDYAGFVNSDAMYNYSQSNVSQMMSRAGPMGQMAPMTGALLRFRTMFFEQFIRESARALGMDQYASPEQQQAARRFMTGYLSTTIILTGMLGLPFVNAMAPGWDRLMDELEPEKRPHDIRASFIQFIGDMMGTSFDDQTAAQITRTLIEGVPATAGVPLQSRIGAQDTFPFTDTVWDNPKPFKDKIWDALKTFFGIPTETLIDMADGVAKIANGDTEAGVKQIARSPAKDIIAVWRMMDDGKFRDAQGKVLPIEDATTQDIFQRLLGFSSTKEAEYQLERAAVDRREKPLQQEAARIVNAMALARQNNDWEKYEALAEQAREYRDRTGENLIKRAETLYKRRRTELREAERSGLPLRAPKKDQPLRELMSGYTGLRENP